MTTTVCPRCGAAAEGNYCASCGAALAARHCTECGAALTPGARFCTACGTGVTAASTPGPATGSGTRRSGGASVGGGGGGEPHVAWWFAGGLLVLLIVVVAWPIVRPDQVATTPAAGPTPTGAAAVDLTSMTPRQAADSLFGRVMRAASASDSAQVAQFVPMAVMAYERARPLDSDGLFHLASMQHLAGDFAAARATVEEGLERDADHLLLLYAGGQAAQEMDDRDGAVGYYQRLIDKYDAEMASANPDYEAHRNLMSTTRSEALNYVNGTPAGGDR